MATKAGGPPGLFYARLRRKRIVAEVGFSLPADGAPRAFSFVKFYKPGYRTIQ
ncbi:MULTISPECIES: hypothetical protein [Geobacillus]|uniref:Uncharacterized protein n=1 Tax=Geobacillus proteiniphilus TaxID=860353 RepID=A0A1Q5TAF0_9BACL|nr:MULTISPECIES: hypothetical protein [Geobacillus]OKO97161.1 hypothetical protein BRO54_0174 [Geobacillus proteiniphilus]